MWKCVYCGNNNPGDIDSCNSCRLSRGGSLKPNIEEIHSVTEEQHSVNEELHDLWFDRIIYKILTWLKLTSGIGIIGFGVFWFGFINYIIIKPQNIYQQQIAETYFLQAEIGLVIVGIGIIIMEIKKNRDK